MPSLQLQRTLDLVADAARPLKHPWWIIGSAAAVLAGLDEAAADVDLLTSVDDAKRLLSRWSAEPPSPSPLFRSRLFGRVSGAPLPIEVMAGLEVRGIPLMPMTRIAVPWRDSLLFIPDRDEQIAILELFGRGKDLRRAERLKSLGFSR